MLPLIASLTRYLVSGLAILGLVILLVEIMDVGEDFRILVLLWQLFGIPLGRLKRSEYVSELFLEWRELFTGFDSRTRTPPYRLLVVGQLMGLLKSQSSKDSPRSTRRVFMMFTRAVA